MKKISFLMFAFFLTGCSCHILGPTDDQTIKAEYEGVRPPPRIPVQGAYIIGGSDDADSPK